LKGGQSKGIPLPPKKEVRAIVCDLDPHLSASSDDPVNVDANWPSASSPEPSSSSDFR
jgi:hypothetical protein